MFATCLTLIVISVQAGHVVAIPHATPLIEADRFHWVLQEQGFRVPPGTRGIVTRVSPDGMVGVVEVKVFDGTNRLGWLADTGLTAIAPARSPQVAGTSTSFARSENSGQTKATRRQRQIQRARLTAIDQILGSMIQTALQVDAATPTGPIIVHPETFQVPVVNIAELIVPIF